MITEFILKGFPEVVVKVCENEVLPDDDFIAVCGNTFAGKSIEFAINQKHANNKQIIDAVFDEFIKKFPPAQQLKNEIAKKSRRRR